MAMLPRAAGAHVNRHRGREQFDGPHLLIPELTHLGWDAFARAKPEGLGEHTHNGWELCYLVRGSVEWWVGDEVHRLEPGQVYVTKPNEAHGGVDRVMHPCELYWVGVLLTPASLRRGMEKLQADAIASGFAHMHARVFPAPALVPELFEKILAEHRNSAEHAPAAARSLLRLLLIEILRAHDRHMPVARNPSPAIVQAIRLMSERLDSSVAIESVAKAVGLGVSRFHERFLAEVAATPLEFLTRLRVDRAQTMLSAGSKIPFIAQQLGFGTREYFSAVFRKVTGMSPAAWREQHRTSSSSSSSSSPSSSQSVESAARTQPRGQRGS